MASKIPVDPHLTKSDRLVLKVLLKDRRDAEYALSDAEQELLTTPGNPPTPDSGYESKDHSGDENVISEAATSAARQRHSLARSKEAGPNDDVVLEALHAINNPKDARFEPSVFAAWDLSEVEFPAWVNDRLLQPYIRWASTVVRAPTDIIMVTHLIIYFTVIVPSAILLFRNFTYIHAIPHWIFVSWCVGSYTLMRHQHIHMRGVLSSSWAWLDHSFPYLLDPLIGHTWNSYFYHHVKHHHVEGNGPLDLSSTIRYQRDSAFHFLLYFLRFAALIWLELPLYFIRKGKPGLALKAAFWEFSSYIAMYTLARYVNFRAALFTLIIPFALLRLGLMVGNWGQHALVDEVDPASDFRTSITLIDVPSNRYSFNDGYHTSHHLNPLRHWRDHPAAFFAQKERYAAEGALVFANIDYIMLTVRLLRKEYAHLARECFVPIGEAQKKMSVDEVAAMLKTKTRAMSEEEIKARFR